MADSENSRTLPTISRGKKRALSGSEKRMPYVINRRNLLSLAARVLIERLSDLPHRTIPGPTYVREIWPDWWELYQKRLQVSRLRQHLGTSLLKETGGPLAVEVLVPGHDKPIFVHSSEEIKSLLPTIGPERTAQVRAALRRRRREWKKADARIGYNAALAEEEEIIRTEGIAGRVLLVLPPYYRAEMAAKLHCLLVMQDPNLKLELGPWPELRTMLKEFIHTRSLPPEPSANLRWKHIGEPDE